jgi:hypothetical protein
VSVATASERLVPDPPPGALESLHALSRAPALNASEGRSTRAIERDESMRYRPVEVSAVESCDANAGKFNRTGLCYHCLVSRSFECAAMSVYCVAKCAMRGVRFITVDATYSPHWTGSIAL